MKCKKVRRLLPLMVGDDLPPSKAAAVTSHLEKCPKCREEYDMCMASFQAVKTSLDRDRMEWVEADWQRAINRAIHTNETKDRPKIRFKKVWAYSLMAGAVVILALFIFRPYFTHFNGQPSGKKPQPAAAKETQTQEQEIVSMTLVSKKTGLKIKWFLNKNFDLEDKK